MTIRDLNYIKSRFERGDKPTAEDYLDLIDTLSAKATELGTSGNNEQIITGIDSETEVDTFSRSTWRMVKYIISLSKTDDENNYYFATELSLLIDPKNIHVSQYGLIGNDGDMGTISVSRDGDDVHLVVTPASVTPITVRYARMGLKA